MGSPLWYNMCSVIVSQWTSMLQIVAVHLRQMGLRYGIIDGSVNPKRRMDLVEEFNTNPKGPQVNLTQNRVLQARRFPAKAPLQDCLESTFGNIL